MTVLFLENLGKSGMKRKPDKKTPRISKTSVLYGICRVYLSFVATMMSAIFAITAQADPFAYVVNGQAQSFSENISVIDIATDTVVTTIDTQFSIEIAITPDGKFLYVTNSNSVSVPDTVTVIETASNSVVTSVAIGSSPSATSLVGIAISPDGNLAYVIDNGTNSIAVIDTASNTVIANVPVGINPWTVAFTPDGKFAYVPNILSDNVTVIDTATHTVSATIPAGSGPKGIAITPDGKFAYVTNIIGGTILKTVTVIDTATHLVVSTITVGDLPWNIAITPDGKYAYVPNWRSHDVSVIETETNTVVATVVLFPLQRASNVAITSDGKFAYVTNEGSQHVSVIDTSTNTVSNTIMVGDRPRSIAIAAAPSNAKPTANAGLDQAIRAGDTVSLDGSASFDDNTASAALIYNWSFTSMPGGSSTVLAGAATANPSFVVDITGTYELSLTVTDEGGLVSDADTIEISSENLAPTAAAGDDQLVFVGTNTILDGSTSDDPENDALTFDWTLTTPVGSAVTLNNPTNVGPNFTPDIEGVYSAELTVSDFLGAGTPDTVEITASYIDNFAISQIMIAAEIVSGLSETEVTTQGNQTAFGNFLTQAIVAIQISDIAEAIDKVTKAIARTDGCALRGSPDGNGQGRDWITSCAAQARVYAALNEALDALLAI